MQGRVLSRARLTQVCTVLHPGDLTPKPGSIYWVFRPRFLGLVCHKWPHVCALNCRNRPYLTCVKILSGIRHCYAYGHILISNARKPFLNKMVQKVKIENLSFSGEACWWTVHPASKQRSEGEKVLRRIWNLFWERFHIFFLMFQLQIHEGSRWRRCHFRLSRNREVI